MSQVRVLKRYGNRKLYDCAESRYVSLDHVADLIRAGMDISVLDHQNGDDMTRLVLTQVLFEQHKRGKGDAQCEGIVQALLNHMNGARLDSLVHAVRDDARTRALMRRLQKPVRGVRQMLESAQERVGELQAEVERLRANMQMLEKKVVSEPSVHVSQRSRRE